MKQVNFQPLFVDDFPKKICEVKKSSKLISYLISQPPRYPHRISKPERGQPSKEYFFVPGQQTQSAVLPTIPK